MSLEDKAVSAPAAAAPLPGTRHPGLALFVLTAAELMVVLDATIVNIALPSIQTALHVSAGNLAWVVNAYALAFGGLMLLGGRAGDLFGRRRMFRGGIAFFTGASLLGGVAPNTAVLITARVLQGAGAAVAAPTALALIATTFAEGKPRNRAMGLYAAMAGVGSAVGLLLGGALTQYLDWRWVLLINIPIGVAVLIGTSVLAEPRRTNGRLDGPGAAVGTAGLVALVYGINRAGVEGWGDTGTLICFALAAVLLPTFIVTQIRGSYPMLPMSVLRDRNRGGAYATLLCVGVGMFSTFYFTTLFQQEVLGYGAVRTGLGYLPFTVAIGAAATISSRLVSRVPPRFLLVPGLLLAACGMLVLSTLTPHTSFVSGVLPGTLITGFGLGSTFVPLTVLAVHKVRPQESGSASAMLNTSQQIGGALGLASLATLVNAVANRRLPHAGDQYLAGLRHHDPALVARAADAMTHGYTRGYLVSLGVFVLGAVIAAVVLDAPPQDASDGATTGH
ncbi:MFS transporter [Streptomyces sp. NBC_01198]|uniref:MFS transporter n=1 Tax=Streptomyces sp. NBC_01198 TaxID=2903769 RepID=UPI002E0E056E|nr:MFS transporter [Streptomyces sp. NBC_01198]